VGELVLGWDGISPEKPGVAESKLVCIKDISGILLGV
jgi:hypothetical protein